MSQSANASSCKAQLKIESPSGSVVSQPLENGRSVFVGSGASCGIQIQGEGVAEIHCLIDVDGSNIAVQDWASQSGTIVNGNSIDDRTPLGNGDEIVLGTIRILLQCSDVPSSDLDATPVKEAVAEYREESVGMEHLGVEEQPDPEPVDEIPAPTPTPSIVQPSGRLSDAFRRSAPIDEPCADENEPDVEVAYESDVDADSNDLVEQTTVDSYSAESDEVDANIDAWTNPQDTDTTAEDIDFDPFALDEEIDVEMVQLLRSEIEDLRIQLAERDEEIAAFRASDEFAGGTSDESGTQSDAVPDAEFGGADLVQRVDELLAELEEHDERVATLQDLLQSAEMQNEAERDERACLENWVGEIEQRIKQRESEWQAEQDALRQRIEDLSEERDQLQQKLVAATQRYGEGGADSQVADETLANLQSQNAELQKQLEEAQKQLGTAARQLKRQQDDEPESVKNALAELAQEKASVSRMRFQLSKQLEGVGESEGTKDQPDKEFAFKLQTLREHLREIHEEEKQEREKKQDSLFGRISNLWKRVDDEY